MASLLISINVCTANANANSNINPNIIKADLNKNINLNNIKNIKNINNIKNNEFNQAQTWFSRYGQSTYPDDFKHFNYVQAKIPTNPHIKQDLKLSSLGNDFFNTFNPFILRGNAAPGLDLLFDSLFTGSWDEEDVSYGLLAKNMAITKNGLKIRFEIDENARFSNQQAVRADDVLATFNTLMQEGTPSFKIIFKGVRSRVISERVIEFALSQTNPDMPNLLGGLSIFSREWLQQIKAKTKGFEYSNFLAPIASGPYTVKNFEAGKFIEYQKNQNYWAKNQRTRLGMYHFNNIRFESYQEDLGKLEAFKAGAFDALVEYRAKSWAKSYQGEKFTTGELIKKEFTHQNPTGLQGFVMNLRRPLFQDVRHRQALSLLLNFPWLNRQLFYKQYAQTNSYFTNSIFSSALANDKNLNKNNKNIKNNNINEGDVEQALIDYSAFRENLKKAQNILNQAGWVYDVKQQILIHPKYGRFEFTLIDSGPAMGRIIAAFAKNLKKIGVQLNYQMSDPALQQKRLDQFDYDMAVVSYGNGNLPGPELWQRFSSETANVQGSENLLGLQKPEVDAMIKKILAAKNKTELVAAAQNFDAYMLSEYYIIPHWYSNQHRVAYQKNLMHPQALPKYYSAHDWLIATWWKK